LIVSIMIEFYFSGLPTRTKLMISLQNHKSTVVDSFS